MSFSHLLLTTQAIIFCVVLTADASVVASLNRVTFAGNVFAPEGEGPEGFVVLFCAEWYEPCQLFRDTFLATASQHGRMSDDDLLSRTTRFALVDCAIDKVLCNSQDVEAYPTAVHYRRGGRAGEWSFSGRSMEKEAKSFTSWLSKQMKNVDKGKELDMPSSLAARSAAGRSVAFEDESSGIAKPVSTPFSIGASLPQGLPMLVLLATAGMWLFRMGSELMQGVELLRESLREDRKLRDRKQGRQEHKPQPAEPQPAEHALGDPSRTSGCLPESWCRGSIVL